MDALSIAIIVFLVLESLNVVLLYFAPGTKKGNGVGVFLAYEKSRNYPEIHAFVRYLVNWVAGTKLIFIVLLVVVVFTGSRTTKLLTVAALILSITTFYWRLYPAIRRMDKQDSISPKGYSKTLFAVITIFLSGFAAAIVISLLSAGSF